MKRVYFEKGGQIFNRSMLVGPRVGRVERRLKVAWRAVCRTQSFDRFMVDVARAWNQQSAAAKT